MSQNRIVHDINSLNRDSRRQLLSAIVNNNIPVDDLSISRDQLKSDMIVHGILSYFIYNDLPVDNGKTSYSTFRGEISSKLSYEPQKRIYFGMRTFSDKKLQIKDLPREYVRTFADRPGWGKWALLYIFEGMTHNTIDLTDVSKSPYEITASLLRHGMDGVVHSHNESESSRRYKGVTQIPHAKQIFRNMPGLEKVVRSSFTQREYFKEKGIIGRLNW